MADIFLERLGGGTVVIYFGGVPGSIDAETFAKSLLGFVQTARAINAVVDPGREIEIDIEDVGDGSFRALLRLINKGGVKGFFSDAIAAVFWGVVANVIYDNYVKNEPTIQVIVKTDEVIIAKGSDRVIVPRSIHDATENAKRDPEVQKAISKTFEPLEANKEVSSFGFTQRMTDAKPFIEIPRESFPRFMQPAMAISLLPEKVRTRSERARVIILKAWLNHKKRKWSFEWNGVPISAPILDDDFLEKIDKREYLMGAGDALDVDVSFQQHYDESLGVYKNDPNSFVISQVTKVIPRE